MEKNSTLNPEQQIAVEHVDGPLLVLAGAGAGKTRIVTHRIARLLDLGVHPSEILAVTFTNKAASEMQERVARLYAQRVLICTFHSLGARILRESIGALGYAAEVTIYDQEDSDKLLRDCMHKLGIKTTEVKPKVFRSMISDAKNRLQEPNDIDPATLTTSNERIFPDLYNLYQARLREYGALDFDDLLVMTVRLFRECPEALALYQEQWRYLLIDEYQDTNHAQYEMARLLVGPQRNLFVVGDPDQSIYSWRGANIQNILNFERDYPGAKVVRLEQNYRSTSTILDAANTLIRNNRGRYEKNLWSTLGEGEKIELIECESDRDEAEAVVSRIVKRHNKDGIPLQEMAIFYRTNAQSRRFEDSLLAAQLPYVIVGGQSFYQRREIKDILAFLRIVRSGSDFLSFTRTINLPKRGIGDATLEKIGLGASQAGMGVVEYAEWLVAGSGDVRLSAKQREGLEEYLRIIRQLRQMVREGAALHELVSETIHLTHYLSVLRADEETFQDRKANLDELIGKAAEWQDNSEGGTLEDFLEELSLRAAADESPETNLGIRLMTMHNGKGLEFQAVYLVGMEEGLFPHMNSRGSDQAVEEERRLCYVGMTRAKQFLHISSARNRFLWGASHFMRPSRFLSEIPERYTYRAGRSPTVTYRPAPAPTATESEEAQFGVGDRVHHQQFGGGVVQDVSRNSLGLIYRVLFDRDSGPKTLVAKFANLS